MKPWYKQATPWLLMVLPLSAVVGGIITINIALQDGGVTLVADDYYKDGKAIKHSGEKKQQAKTLGIKMAMQLNDKTFSLSYLSGKPEQTAALHVSFHHSTLKQKDVVLLLTADAEGNYHHTFEQDMSGKWQVSVENFSKDWKVASKVSFPRSSAFNLEP